jgi:steroid 5-alpha reductase family enzyme
MQSGLAYYYWAAFIYVFMMQALFSLIVNGAALFVSIWSTDEFFWLDVVGAAVWAFGFIFELVSDYQLQAFRDDPANRGKLIKSGLWRYSRHPNYFGEALLWWGIYIIACSVAFGWITVFAPAFITILVRFISGVPLLENKYKDRPEFQEYMKETNVFAPWFVRKVT